MAKQKFNLEGTNELIRRAQAMLDTTKETVREVRQERKKMGGCIEHPLRLVVSKYGCVECDANARNLNNKKLAEKEPWESTNGSMYIYNDEGKPQLYHRFLMEKKLERRLDKKEVVKFRDENKLNCSLDNLYLANFICKHCGGEN